MSREIKFRAWDNVDYMSQPFSLKDVNKNVQFTTDCKIMQFTGLQDKNGSGKKEVYEGDIISKSSIVGNIYETNPREADLVVQQLGTKAWEAAYKEAVARGFNYAE